MAKYPPPSPEQIAAMKAQAAVVTALVRGHTTQARAQNYEWRRQRLAANGGRIIEINSSADEERYREQEAQSPERGQQQVGVDRQETDAGAVQGQDQSSMT